MKVDSIIKYIVKWLTDYSDNTQDKGFVVGISGGIDSALTSTLCALTQKRVLCIEMPIYQDPNQVSRALNHIQYLESRYPNVSSKSIDLNNVFQNIENDFSIEDANADLEHLTFANTRSRLRMLTLYHYATLNKMLVVGTGNKIEDFGIGFFTKYGDGGVDISPIADLNKSQVYKLAVDLGIHSEIIEAKPTDGLWGDERTDEDQIGATYPELEWAMDIFENNKNKTDFSKREQEVLAIYRTYHKKNQHKMQPIPVCEIPKQML